MSNLKDIELYKNPNDNWKEEIINGKKMHLPLDFNSLSINEISNINFGTRITKKNNIGATNYPVVGSGNDSFFTNTFNRENEVTIGRFALSKKCINSHNKKFFLNDSGMTLSSKRDNQQLLEFLLFKNEQQIYRCARGSAQKNMDMRAFEKLKLILPNDVKEQEKIASILTKQEELIFSKKELLKKYKKQRKYFQQELLSGRIRLRLNQEAINEALYLDLIILTSDNDYEIIEDKKEDFESWLNISFENKIELYKNINWKEENINGREIEIPNDWKKDKVSNFKNIDIENGYAFKTSEFNKGNYFLIKIGNIQDNKIELKKENQKVPNKDKKFQLEKNDLIVGMSGADAGKSGVFNLNEICFLNQRNLRIRTNSLFFNILYSCVLKKYLLQNIRSMGIPNISSKNFEELDYFSGNILEQTLIATQLTKIDNLIDSLEEDIKLEDKKFTYLKQELLSGRIRVK